MDIKLIEETKNLGFQTNEARVYLAVLELGKGTVTQIVKLAGLNRTTGYDILERLAIQGVISRSRIGKKNIYIAEPPIRLKQHLSREKKIVENKIEKPETFFPNLESLYKTDLKPSIKFYEGRQSMRDVYKHDILEAKSTIYCILDVAQFVPEFKEFGIEHAKDRTKLKIREYNLVYPSQEAQTHWNETYKTNQEKLKYTEYRWLNYDLGLPRAAEIMIFDNKIIGVLFKPEENMVFEIISESFANSFKTLYEIVWAQSKPFE